MFSLFAKRQPGLCRRAANPLLKTLPGWLLLAALGSPPALAGEQSAILVHRLKPGQTFALLARLCGLPVERILNANPGLDPYHLMVGTSILIPEPEAGWPHYRVAPNDTLTTISERTSSSLEALCLLNRMSPDQTLTVDQELILPAPAPAPTVQNSAESPALPSEDPAGAELGAQAASLSPSGPAGHPTGLSVAGPLASPTPEPTWQLVHLADGRTAWAPTRSLLSYSPTPLTKDSVVTIALRFVGTPYRWGGITPNGVDCSGFVREVYMMAGRSLPRLADEQFAATLEVDREQLEPGDLVFFTTYLPGPSHVGIYLGEGRFIHASSSRGVCLCDLDDAYFAPRFLGGRRFQEPKAGPTAEAPATP